LDGVKWKKIIKCQLEGAPKGQLKLKKLVWALYYTTTFHKIK
jgi:hypothetical protein